MSPGCTARTRPHRNFPPAAQRLLASGLAAPLLYLFTVVLGGLLTLGYSHLGQDVSELIAHERGGHGLSPARNRSRRRANAARSSLDQSAMARANAARRAACTCSEAARPAAVRTRRERRPSR